MKLVIMVASGELNWAAQGQDRRKAMFSPHDYFLF